MFTRCYILGGYDVLLFFPKWELHSWEQENFEKLQQYFFL